MLSDVRGHEAPYREHSKANTIKSKLIVWAGEQQALNITLHLLVKPDYERAHCISVCVCTRACADTNADAWPFMADQVKQPVKMRILKTTCFAVTLVLFYIYLDFLKKLILKQWDQLGQTSKKPTEAIIHSPTQTCNQAAEKTAQ